MIRVRQGQLVEVQLVNESVPDGITLHWHGVDVPNAEDGVAGVTQDAVPVGGEFTYRFVADAGRDLLVPLAPGVPRAGAAAGCSARSWSTRRAAADADSRPTDRSRSCTSTTGSARSTARDGDVAVAGTPATGSASG